MEIKNYSKPCGCHFVEGEERPWYVCIQHFHEEAGKSRVQYDPVAQHLASPPLKSATELSTTRSVPKAHGYALTNPHTKELDLGPALPRQDNEVIKHYWLYALKLEGDRYYIGMTARRIPYDRIRAHRDMSGARWTMLHKPLQIYEIRDIGRTTKLNAEMMEQKLTLAYMQLYGYKNVRGGEVTYTGRIFKFGKHYIRGNWIESLVVMLTLFALSLYILVTNV